MPAIVAEAAALEVEDLHVRYGHSHALQGVSLRLEGGVLAVVGRNGMGKSTLCGAVVGLVPSTGTIRVHGRAARGLAPNRIARLGVGYVPQGRRTWRSLTVDEHLRLVAPRGRDAAWTVERVYATFPRLAERRRNGGGTLSGGEQQMLAIGRALLANPTLLVMDEPTEGLAPVIVAQVATLLRQLAAEGAMAVLLVEQNIGVATTVADRVAIMVNGRIAREVAPGELAADFGLQQRLLGMGRQEDAVEATVAEAEDAAVVRVFSVVRPSEAVLLDAPALVHAGEPPTRYADAPRPALRPAAAAAMPEQASDSPPMVAEMTGRHAYVVGTFDTKGRELLFIRNRLQAAGIPVRTVDLSTSGKPSPADVAPAEVARCHPRGGPGVFGTDRGAAVSAMAEAFSRFLAGRGDVGGIISAGGSGGTALATPAMQGLPVGVPKMMVSTVVAGDVARYVGASDICMMPSVTDVSGINRISEQVLGNAAHALAGMMAHARRLKRPAAEMKPAIGLTMFGVTTPCVQAVQRRLEESFDCLVFHATGTGGRAMEKLAASGLLAGAIDVSTTEIADLLVGGVFPAGEDRLDAFVQRRIPYVGSVGACDMVNFGPRDRVPDRFRGRLLHVHNAGVTLMRTTAEECAAIGRWIAGKLNQMQGRVRFLLPEGGVSALDAPGQPFHDPAADRALFDALASGVRQTASRTLIRLPLHINDPAFAAALAENFTQIAG